MTSARRKTLKQNLIAYSFILPNLLGFTIFTLVPMVFSLALAFMHWDGANVVTWAWLDNFKQLLRDTTFRISLVNTFYYVIGTVPPTMAAALGLARSEGRSARAASSARAWSFHRIAAHPSGDMTE